MRHPLGAHLNPNLGRPAYLAATTDGQGHRRVSHLRSGCTKPGQNPRMSIHCPPSMASPAPAAAPRMQMMCSWAARTRGSAISPTDLECPDGSSPTIRAPPPPLPSRCRQDTSPADAPRGERLQFEGTDNALRRTWSALRSIQVVVCLFVNVIEALVHPRHPPPPRGALQVPGHSPPSLGKVVGKVVGVFFFLNSPPPLLTDPTAREREGERESERVP